MRNLPSSKRQSDLYVGARGRFRLLGRQPHAIGLEIRPVPILGEAGELKACQLRLAEALMLPFELRETKLSE